MNHWPFIIAAYGLTGIGTLVLTVWSFVSMRRAEAAVKQVDQDA